MFSLCKQSPGLHLPPLNVTTYSFVSTAVRNPTQRPPELHFQRQPLMWPFWSLSFFLSFFLLCLRPIPSLSLSLTCIFLKDFLLFFSEGKLACVMKTEIPWQSVLPLLQLPLIHYIHTLNPPLSAISLLFFFISPPPLLCDDMYVLMETRCGPVAMEEAAREREKPCMGWYGTSLTGCRICRMGAVRRRKSKEFVVSRVQTVSVLVIWNVPTMLARPWAKRRGFPCRYSWVRVRVHELVEPESASRTMEVFSCRAIRDMGLSWGSWNVDCSTSLHLRFFHPHNPNNLTFEHFKETAPTAPRPSQSAGIVLSSTKAGM